jgi:predicted nucleic acid-binding protein
VRSNDCAHGTASTATASTAVRFVDTNVLLCAISRDPEEQDKAARANDILAARDVALSTQVLQEFYVQATRASRPDPLTHAQATGLIESFLSEDLSDSQDYAGVRVQNPFRTP